MNRDERISQVIDEILKSDSFDELLANEEVSLSISNFIKNLIQQDMKKFVSDIFGPIIDEKTRLRWNTLRKRHFGLFTLLEIDLEHVKAHLRDATLEKAISIVDDEILHPED